MATVRRFEEIEAWQLARQMTVEVSALTKRLPFQQDGETKDQMRAAHSSATSKKAAQANDHSTTHPPDLTK
ncbi:MAG: four helix bundle protein [Caldilineaceae bacterium]|nr:four helix bundle protein [Caldilineaceae bacterium]